LVNGINMRFLYLTFLFSSILFVSCEQSIEEIEKLPETERGKALYDAKCASCHGEDGMLGSSGAKDLSQSTLSDSEVKNSILYGNEKGMPPFKDQLGAEENLNLLVTYVKSLRK
jgi:mono/diheme cytochrome c family protein